MAESSDLVREVSSYFAGTLGKHGATARGVDWNGEASQFLRFTQLSSIIATSGPISVNDIGSGYGAFFDYLVERFAVSSFLGVDIAPEMVDAGRARYASDDRVRFLEGAEPDRVADYGFASGTFNFRGTQSDENWFAFVQKTLDAMDRTSSRGFAFNCLTSYSEPEKMVDHLYYANPLEVFDMCKRKYSRQVALLHDYGVWEFTIRVRKDT